MVIKLKSQPEFSKSISKSEIRHPFIGRTLMGSGKVVVSPLTWIETGGKSLVQVSSLGMGLYGHPGIVHGGMLATMLDAGFANCCSAAFPKNNGRLTEYQLPTLQFLPEILWCCARTQPRCKVGRFVTSLKIKLDWFENGSTSTFRTSLLPRLPYA